MNNIKICVIGLGYIGLPTSAMFATHRCQVVGVDVNERCRCIEIEEKSP